MDLFNGLDNQTRGDLAAIISERFCAHPVEVAGGWLVRCGSRLQSKCLSYSRLYANDWSAIIRSGVFEADVTAYQWLFLTLTAPSWGRTHHVPKGSETSSGCSCGTTHDPSSDGHLRGLPVDPVSYDYDGAVRWNRDLGQLWDATRAKLRAHLPDVEFALIREWQLRGSLHTHAVLRIPRAQSMEAAALGALAQNTRTWTPKGNGTSKRHEVYPFSLAQLRSVYEAQKEHNLDQAEVSLFLGLTGLRWGEMVALRVRDVQEIPYPALRVSRSGPDGHAIRNRTKGGEPRSVPLAHELLPIVEKRLVGKLPDALVFTAPEGGRMNGNNWRRAIRWSTTGSGRRIHGLRHTAASLWISAGIGAKTVQTWLGHASMTLTVDLYGHFMGDDASRAGMERFESSLGDASGTNPPRSKNAENL